MKTIIVVSNLKDNPLDFTLEGVELVAAKDYLVRPDDSMNDKLMVYNLCRSYRYQSIGYYVSLLAEARGQKVVPNVATIQDLKSQAVVKILSEELDELVQKNFARIQSKEFVLSIYFGKSLAASHEKLARQLFNLFQAPLLRATFSFSKKWQLQNISPISLKDIPEDHLPLVKEFAEEFFAHKYKTISRKKRGNFDLAILVNPTEKAPPSDEQAIKRFVKAGNSLGMNVELITKDDYSRLPEFDALFIRETTAVNHHTYRFAQRAHNEGLVVMDDPFSILRCTNKVYLAEMLTKAKLPTPKTLIVHKDNWKRVEAEIGFPCVVKQPDSSFSQGVVKVNDAASYKKEIKALFEKSDLMVVQEFLPTEYDWRIGVLNKTPLYACKYYMAKGHWQIYNWEGKKKEQEGKSQTLPIEHVPSAILKAAEKAANLIGDGFYGVDIKQEGKNVYVIEVNDNPSVEHGVEDEVLQNDLYLIIMRTFLKRLEAKLNR